MRVPQLCRSVEWTLRLSGCRGVPLQGEERCAIHSIEGSAHRDLLSPNKVCASRTQESKGSGISEGVAPFHGLSPGDRPQATGAPFLRPRSSRCCNTESGQVSRRGGRRAARAAQRAARGLPATAQPPRAGTPASTRAFRSSTERRPSRRQLDLQRAAVARVGRARRRGRARRARRPPGSRSARSCPCAAARSFRRSGPPVDELDEREPLRRGHRRARRRGRR